MPKTCTHSLSGKEERKWPAKNKMIRQIAKYGTDKARPKLMPRIIKKEKAGVATPQE